MNRGVYGFPVGDRIRFYESEPTTITTATALKFPHGFSRIPRSVDVRLVCAVAGLGYVEGQEIPISMLIYQAGSSEDGQPRWNWRADSEAVTVYIPSGSIQILDTTAARQGFVAANWKLIVRASHHGPRP